MNKDKKKPCKKTFVRNTVQEKPKITVVNEQSKKTSSEPKVKDTKPDEKPKIAITTIKFDTPNVNSALMLAKKAESIQNTSHKKAKSILSLPNVQKLAIDEKVRMH